ncbi:MAG: bifunctional diguanylate cyclase/phosphodiesterase [Clostridia bacterium]|nr:bifunctional diguanylate cyclase/phosphodiesterase [Clostridia bacterium]
MNSKSNEYSIIKYDASTGLLMKADGTLFDKFKIRLSPTLADLKIDIHTWPFAKTDRYTFTRDICDFLDGSNSDTKSQFTTQFALIVNDSKYWINVFTIVFQENGSITKALIFTLVDDYKSEIDEYINSAEKDSLTGVLNRDPLQRVVNDMLLKNNERAVLLFDIDSFKTLNDTYGHAAGDKLLAVIIKNILGSLGKRDQIGRIGGDEFFIILDKYKDRDSVEYFAQNLCASVKRALPNGMIVSMSVGIVIAPQNGSNFNELYDNADRALSYVKNNGGDSICFYDDIKDANDFYDITEINKSTNMIPTSDVSHMIRYCYKTKDNGIFKQGDYYLSDSFCEVFDLSEGETLRDRFKKSSILSEIDWEEAVVKIRNLISSGTDTVLYFQFRLKVKNGTSRWFNICIAKESEANCLYISIADVHDFVVNYKKLKNLVDYDELTGLHTRRNFVSEVSAIISREEEALREGKYALIYFDISKFKMINDIFGLEKGDQLLMYLADSIGKVAINEYHACRIASDRFAIFMKADYDEVERFTRDFISRIEEYPLAFKVVCNFGVYITDGSTDSVELMIDRAAIAQSSIKGSVVETVSYFADGLRNNLLNEHTIINEMTNALKDKQFRVFYQPQFNHSTGELVGAEALVRWFHPDKGMVSPGGFISVFEKNGFITFLDLFVLEEVCKLLRKMIDDGITPVPISINLSRCDIFRTDLIGEIERIRRLYKIDTELVRLEITESTMSEENLYAKNVIEELHRLGYMIEMDDFGTGYSSLNVLKNIKMDVIKLDMEFIADSNRSNRAGKILRSIIRMATWLNMPVIAEGVETEFEANYLKSIGCNIIQGYYYSKPIPTDKFTELVRASKITKIEKSSDTIDDNSFWSPNSLEDAMFNRFVGPAAILEYNAGTIELMRMNEKLISEIGNGVDERTLMRTDIDYCMDKYNFDLYLEACKKAVNTNEEVVVETWRNYGKDDESLICLRSTIKVVEIVGESYILYSLVENVTEGHKASEQLKKDDQIFDSLCESLDIYMWEYDLDNDILYPCKRCRKNLLVPQEIRDFSNNELDIPLFGKTDANKLTRIHDELRQGNKFVKRLIVLDSDGASYIVKYDVNSKATRDGNIAYASAVRCDRQLLEDI